MRGIWANCVGLAFLISGLIGGMSAEVALAGGSHTISGVASFYDKNYKGKTASGERYDATKFTVAHRTLPFGTKLRVTDKRTKRSVTVTVNDRGPFIKGRVLDLSYAAATALGMQGRGLAAVTASIEE